MVLFIAVYGLWNRPAEEVPAVCGREELHNRFVFEKLSSAFGSYFTFFKESHPPEYLWIRLVLLTFYFS